MLPFFLLFSSSGQLHAGLNFKRGGRNNGMLIGLAPSPVFNHPSMTI
jgi:hypothetical protein